MLEHLKPFKKSKILRVGLKVGQGVGQKEQGQGVKERVGQKVTHTKAGKEGSIKGRTEDGTEMVVQGVVGVQRVPLQKTAVLLKETRGAVHGVG